MEDSGAIMPVNADFRIDVRPEWGRVVVAPCGDLDIATAEPLERVVLELRDRGFAQISLDLRKLTFFDSSALHLLLRLDAQLRQDACDFALIDGDRDGVVEKVLRITGTHDVFRHTRL